MSPRTDRPAPARRPVARHGVLSSPRPVGQVLTFLGALLAVIVVSAGAVGGFYVWNGVQAIEDAGVAIGEDDAPLPPSIGEIEGGVNLLVVGTDSCEGPNAALSGACQEHDTDGERNDVTMLVHISDEPRRVTVVSFPRDMLVPIPSCTGEDGTQHPAMSEQMLNVSYMYGGLKCTALTISELTGVDIRFAAATRWTGVINMSDAIGGVDVCVQNDVHDAYTGLDLMAGTHTLEGAAALQFLRTRYGIGDGSDLGRISNQQQFMSSMVRKLQSGGVLGDPAALLNLATTAVRQVTSGEITLSRSLSNPQSMVQIAMAMRSVPYKDILFVQYPTAYGAADPNRVEPVTSAADVLFQALAANQPLQLTGAASGGSSTEVVGEASAPAPTEAASPEPIATDAAPSAAAPVALPASIPGQTSAEVTCTVGRR